MTVHCVQFSTLCAGCCVQYSTVCTEHCVGSTAPNPATDIVLIAKSPEALRLLLGIVTSHCSRMKMEVSVSKSKIMSASSDAWAMFDGEEVTACLDKVLSFKYLGVETKLSPARGADLMRKRALNLARRYKACCMRVSRSGPDTVEVGMATWCNIAIPSILYGCESVPFTVTAMDEIDRMQSAVAKSVLGLPVSTPNLVAQIVLGLKFFRHKLYEAQLKFFLRVCKLDKNRWSRDAMECHLSGNWVSPYMANIAKIKTEVNMVVGPVSKKHVEIALDRHFLGVVNAKMITMDLPALEAIDEFVIMDHVGESRESQVICIV